MKEPLDIYDLKTRQTDFYEIHLYYIKTENIKNEILDNINNFKTNYIIKFLTKKVSYEEENIVNIKVTMGIYLMKEKEEIMKVKVKCVFIMIFKKSVKYFKEKENINIIDSHIKMGVYDILLLNNYYINDEMEFTII